jgi:pimeloyl-ACP methyl ester carboxylesterase
VIWYDRRGTGASTRDEWPGSGADQHADDAATLVRDLAAGPAVVLGLSSGGVVALALAARHPQVVAEAIAWEAPALSVLPDGLATHAAMMAPVEAHLRATPTTGPGPTWSCCRCSAKARPIPARRRSAARWATPGRSSATTAG